jgi:putative ABC transport system substrate-binding protein
MNNAFLSSEDPSQAQGSRATSGSRGDGGLLLRLLVIAFLLVGSWLLINVSEAAEPARPIRIGALSSSWGPTPGTVGLRDGLQKLGYRENEDFVIGVRFTQGDLAVLPAAVRDLIEYGVDLIFVSYESPAKAAQRATSQIPIVFANISNPVEVGLVQSFARPGGNITGVADLHHELGPKRLEVFRDIIPSLKRVLFLHDAADADSVDEAKAYRDAAGRLGIELVEKAVQTKEEVQATLAQIQQNEVDGILSPRSRSLNIPGFILEASSQQTIPTMFETGFWVERGGLASYGPDYHETGRQAARLVDKILKGANPAEIPVEVNTKIEFAINLKVAKTLGLTIAPEMLYRADRLIR